MASSEHHPIDLNPEDLITDSDEEDGQIEAIFYKNGEIVFLAKFDIYLSQDVSMWDSVDLFLPAYKPYVKKLDDQCYLLDHSERFYKHTIDLTGIQKLCLKSNLAEKRFTLHYSAASQDSIQGSINNGKDVAGIEDI